MHFSNFCEKFPRDLSKRVPSINPALGNTCQSKRAAHIQANIVALSEEGPDINKGQAEEDEPSRRRKPIVSAFFSFSDFFWEAGQGKLLATCVRPRTWATGRRNPSESAEDRGAFREDEAKSRDLSSIWSNQAPSCWVLSSQYNHRGGCVGG